MRRKRKRRREREKRERERKKRTEKKGRAKMGGGEENSLRGSKEEGEEYLLEVVCTRRLLFPRGRVR